MFPLTKYQGYFRGIDVLIEFSFPRNIDISFYFRCKKLPLYIVMVRMIGITFNKRRKKTNLSVQLL